MATSAIEWTELTWNPVTGCDKISAGCLNCYAEKMAKRLKAMGQANYVNGFSVAMHEHVLAHPLNWKKPSTIFVNSMSDIFHKDVSLEFIIKIFDVMDKANWHKYQILTKRAERLSELSGSLSWRDNIWMGVTVENKDNLFRIDHLRKTGAKIKFLSIEPLLEDLGIIDLAGIDWVIVGGESGPGARKMEADWVRSIRNQCISRNIPFFFKQWGGFNKKKHGKILDERVWDGRPEK